jgi:hypothetical protein
MEVWETHVHIALNKHSEGDVESSNVCGILSVERSRVYVNNRE